MFTRARLILIASFFAVAAFAAWASAQSAPTGQNLVLTSTRVDLGQRSRRRPPRAIPRHFANPKLLQEIKTAYAGGKFQPSKGHKSPTPTATPTVAGPPAAIWTPGAGPTPASMSAPFAAMGQLDGGGYEPPDTFVAAGSVNGTTELLEAVNVMGEVYPSGSLLNFGACTPDANIDSVSDPRVLFDAADGRWLISTVTFAPVSDAGWNLLVSGSNDPDPNTGVWYCLHIPTGGLKNPDGSTGNFPDFPKLGFNSDKVVITGDAFSTIQRGFSTSYKFQGTEFVVINKSELLGTPGTPIYVTMFDPPQGDFAIEPAQHLAPTSATTSSDPDILYMASVNSSLSSTATLGLWSVTGVPTSTSAASASRTPLAISAIAVPPNAQQPDSGVLIDTNDDSLLDAVFRDGSPGSLWVSANDACVPPGDSATRSCLRLIEVSINGSSTAIAQDFDVSTGVGTYLYFPAVRTDNAGNLVTVFTGSAANSSLLSPGYASVYTGVQKGNTNALTNFSLVWPGDSAYAVNPPRWGDYSGAGADPSDTAVWIAGEYATSFPILGPLWGTAMVEVTP
jgi:hypothetical protein